MIFMSSFMFWCRTISRHGSIATMMGTRTTKTGRRRDVQPFRYRACPEHSYRPTAHLICKSVLHRTSTIVGNEVLFSVALFCLFVSKMRENSYNHASWNYQCRSNNRSRIMPIGFGRFTHCWSKIHTYFFIISTLFLFLISCGRLSWLSSVFFDTYRIVS